MKLNCSLLVLALTAAKVYAKTCQSSDDCAGDDAYCASGTCLEISKCATRQDCFNPANGPYAAALCMGYIDCLDEQCQMVCGPELCPNGEEYIGCDPNNLPCDLTDCRYGTSCYNDPCGGGACAPVFFDGAGNRVCGPEPTPTNSTNNDCNSDKDCGDESYCAAGSCLAISKCNEVIDCVNPSNSPYPVIECVGFLECSNNNECGIVCGASFCPDGSEPVNCFADPCDVETCDEAVSCTSNYCGGCNAIFFDAAGNHICTGNVTDDDSPDQETCESDEDCGEESYCAAGSCLAVSKCNEVVDCFNPSNSPYPVVACVGFLECSDNNQCGIVCGASLCPDGSEPVNCFADPCDVETCDEAVSCTSNYCGGCNAIFFDAAGNHVCAGNVTDDDSPSPDEEDPVLVSCQSDADCAVEPSDGSSDDSEQYCSQGVCTEVGECTTDADCINPSNVYPIKECTGYITCSQGLCDRICGPNCPDGSAGTACDSRLCDVTDCPGARSCSTDLCNDCAPIYFDDAGFETTKCNGTTATTELLMDEVANGDGSASATVAVYSLSALMVMMATLVVAAV